MDIKIRHSESSDVAAIKAIYEQPSCYAGTLQLPFPSENLWQKRLSEPSENFYNLVAELDGKIIGQAGLSVFDRPRRKHAANMGMGVCEQHRNKGVATQLLKAMVELAFNWLAVRRIELEVYTDNEAAIALYKKHGFEIEGTSKSYAFRDGEYVDVFLMAKLQG